ncbi:MAG: histidine kinase dimerization/phospho-acceptor domain-containing protein [Acidobacteriota bacterium]|nr:histidine kinase dimerization/phospho-acceptor domain-containing protein [Acidobacteriota bacterium]
MLQRVFVVSQDAEFLGAMHREWMRPEWAQAGTLPALETMQPRLDVPLPETAVAILDGEEGLPMLTGAVTLALVVRAPGEAVSEAVAERGLLSLPRAEGWAAVAACLARECVWRREAQARSAELSLRLHENGGDCNLERLTSSARHELANALTAAMGYCELLLAEEQLGEKAHRWSETVYASVRRVDVLLRFMSQKDAGQGVKAPAAQTSPGASQAGSKGN